jgi:hypothetical protein
MINVTVISSECNLNWNFGYKVLYNLLIILNWIIFVKVSFFRNISFYLITLAEVS